MSENNIVDVNHAVDNVCQVCELLNKFPSRFDVQGWVKFLNGSEVLKGMLSVEGIFDALPASKKDLCAINKARESRNTAALQTDNAVQAKYGEKFFKEMTESSPGKMAKAVEQFRSAVIFPHTPGLIFSYSNKAVGVFRKTMRFVRNAKDGKIEFIFRDIRLDANVWERRASASKSGSANIFEAAPNYLIDKYLMSLIYADSDCAVDVINPTTGEFKINQCYAPFIEEKLEDILADERIDRKCVDNYRAWLLSYIDRLRDAYNGRVTAEGITRTVTNVTKNQQEFSARLMLGSTFHINPNQLPVTFTNNPKTAAFSYFNLASLSDGDTPAFDMFCSAFKTEDEKKTFMAYVYAAVDERFKPSQYLWILGEGGNGKSSFLKALYKYFGDHMCGSLSVSSLTSDFGLENTLDKRVIIMSDVPSGMSVKSGVFHNLTGGDVTDVNRKGKAHISAILNPLVIAASNYAPNVNMTNSNERRRLLMVRMGQPSMEVQKKIYVTDENGDFVLDSSGAKTLTGFPLTERLIEEMPHILYKCKSAFDEKISPAFTNIVPTKAEVDMYLEVCNDTEADAIDYAISQCFTITHNPNDTVMSTEAYSTILEFLKNKNMRSNAQFTVTTITRKFNLIDGISVQKRYESGIRHVQYTGLRVNNIDYQNQSVFSDPKDLITPIEEYSAGDLV